MKKNLFLLSFILIAQISIGQTYQYHLDLTKTMDDKLQVELKNPPLEGKSVVFYLPKTVPGTYSTDNYGKFVEQLEAFDKNGKPLKVTRLDDNSWRIYKAKRVKKVTYWVNDSFDEVKGDKPIFEPAGSNIEKDENYVINTHCFFGYFENRKQLPYDVTITHQPNLVATTSMIDTDPSATVDKFETTTYNLLVDSPIMYAKPNNASIKIGDSEVVIGVYSPNNLVSADFLAENLKKLLTAQTSYIGKMPVKKYAFIVYLTDKPSLSGSQGALEHSFSSFYYLGEVAGEAALPMIMDVSAHEFFHILTPLNTHAEEIHYFDFNDPKMSEHLWLYEGSTEYHAHLAQTRYGLKSRQDFYDEMSQKITRSKTAFDDSMPFTEMSKHVLEEKYEPQYGNVYQKGALISMGLDLILRKNSDGAYGIINLINDLSDVYGSEKPFKDGELFDQIEKMTSKEVRTYLDKYVAGSEPLPLEEMLSWVGVSLYPEKVSADSTVTIGSVRIGLNADRQLIIADNSGMNEFGKQMGYENGDILMAINGKEITLQTFRMLIEELNETAVAGTPLTITVGRDVDGEVKVMDLSAPTTKIAVKQYNVLEENPESTPAQIKLRDAWLSAK